MSTQSQEMGRERGGLRGPTDARFVVVQRPSLFLAALAFFRCASCPGGEAGRLACGLSAPISSRSLTTLALPRSLLLRTARSLGSGAVKG